MRPAPWGAGLFGAGKADFRGFRRLRGVGTLPFGRRRPVAEATDGHCRCGIEGGRARAPEGAALSRGHGLSGGCGSG
jgi:hypothetical protein